MPLYFAYGANMNLSAMAALCPRSRPLGRARLARRRLFIMASGYASLARDPRVSVHGLLWSLALADVPALDRYEDVARGLYVKTSLPVLREPVGSARALVYVGRDAQAGAPAPGYLETVVEAARRAGLPGEYVDYLAGLAPAHQRGARP
jgi:gamma-glutamylcyclotransferase (GGCT)/AIG2-like uncharacterized protein YtfP